MLLVAVMLAGSLILAAVLAADGGTPWDAVFLQTEARGSEARSRCVELITSATEIEATDGALAVKRAGAAIELGAPVRDELEAMFLVSPGVAKSIGAVKTARLQALGSQLFECVQSADFLIVRVQRTNQKKSPGSESARKEADATFREYLERYPKHPNAETVKVWLQQLAKSPAK